MSIKVKKAGAYADAVGVFHKRAGAYQAVEGVFVKAGGVYGRVDAAPAGPLDPFFANVTSLLHFDGANDSTDFPDNAPTPLTWTVTSPAKISTAQSVFGGASAEFNGGTSLITTPISGIALGSSDLTVEFRYRAAAYADYYIGGMSGLRFRHRRGPFRAEVSTSEGGLDLEAAEVATSTWTAIAVTRQGNTWRLFKDGVLADTKTRAGSVSAGTMWAWGRHPDFSADNFSGHIDEARITVGVCRYTESYTVESVAFPDA